MFADQMSAAIDGARTLTRLNHLSRALWQGHAAGAIGDEAQRLAEHLHARKTILRGPKPKPPSIFPPRRPQRAPVRTVAIARRRCLAASGPMPPALAAHFTTSQLAVLKIVGDEHSEYGSCSAYLAAIAARAGCCRKTARDAIRLAARHGLVTIQERRREGRVNLTNVVRIVSAEWLQWLAVGPRRKPVGRPEGIGYKNCAPAGKAHNYPCKTRAREKENRPAATPPNSARKEGPPSAGLAEGRSANSEPSRPKPPADPKLEAAIARFLGGRVRP